MKKSVFKITQMDCPSEEQLIRMKLEDFKNIQNLEFDIPNRSLSVYHEENIDPIADALKDLNLGSDLILTDETSFTIPSVHRDEKRLLWSVLIINFSFFVLEIITGLIANSMGLVADSLDMLADAVVYALSLYAVGGHMTTKKRIAKISGYFQMGLAILGLAEVIRRFLGYEDVPGFQTMIIVSLFALSGNALSLYLLQKSNSQEAHMQASMIFTSNDVLANIGVIVAGAIVYFTQTKYPDLIIGTLVFLLVAKGALRILKPSK